MIQNVEIEEIIAFQEIPLTALSKTTLQKLSQMLNSKKILHSVDGYERSWRGLASLAAQNVYISDGNEDPTAIVIQHWCSNTPATATFAYLQQFLGILDRWDVSDDINKYLISDANVFRQNYQPPDASTQSFNDNGENNNFSFGHGSDPSILTISDVERAQNGWPPQMYDAFVLYADADLNFALEILTKLEDFGTYGLKLCMRNRDLLAGVQFQHVALSQLIETRCRHLVVILTAEFFKSPENKFLVNYTQALQIRHKTRKIVPLLYEDGINIPRTLQIYTHLRYNPAATTLYNFWSKLANSIQNVNAMPNPKAATTLSSRSNANSTMPSSSSAGHNGATAVPCRTADIPSSIGIQPPAGQVHSPHQGISASSSFCSDTKKKHKWPLNLFKKRS